PAQEQRLRAVVERRLAAAMADGPGVTLAEVAVRRRRMAAWFRRRRGMARDVVLAGFLEKGVPDRLAQRMPRPLQRLLFRDGKALYGLRGAVPAVGALVAALCLVAVMPGVWEAWAGGAPVSVIESPTPYEELGGQTALVTRVAFSPDGQRVLVAADGGTVLVWRADGTGEPVVLRLSISGMNAAAFSPDGNRIVTVTRDQAVKVWRADGSGAPLVLHGHTGESWADPFTAFSPDGERVLSPFQADAVKIWRADGSGEPVVLRHEGEVYTAAFSPDGRRVVTTSADGTARVWRADGSGTPVELLHAGPVTSAVFSPDGQRILTVSGDSTVSEWRADGSGRPVVLSQTAVVNSAAFSRDGKRIVIAFEDGSVSVWNADGPGSSLSVTPAYPVLSAAFSPDGEWVVVNYQVGSVNRVSVWRVDDSGALLDLGNPEPAAGAAFSPDGERIVTSAGSTARLWGRRPGFPVNVTGCTASPAADAPARSLADSLARDVAYEPVVYAPSAWDSVRLGAPPGRGEVRYAAGDTRGRTAADTLVSMLGATRWKAVGAAIPPGALSVGVCGGTGAPADSMAQVSVYHIAAADTAIAGEIARRLAERGYRVGTVAHRPDGTDTGAENVRYFYREDLPAAQAVASVVREALGAAGAGRFQPRVADQSGRLEAAIVVPQNHIEVWLPDLASWRAGVRIQVHSRETDRSAVLNAVRGLGFPVSTGVPNTEVPAGTRTNAIWYGRQVPLEDVRRVALALMRSGVEIRLIAPFSPPRTYGDAMIQVGSLREGERYGSSTLRARPYSVEEVQAATRFPVR
ncbi:MAG TPA: hypothetical protein VGB15_16095, partial [Longimicrobium sp.]